MFCGNHRKHLRLITNKSVCAFKKKNADPNQTIGDDDVKYLLMEDRLHSKFPDLRKEGQNVKGRWFNRQAKQVMNELYPNVKGEL